MPGVIACTDLEPKSVGAIREAGRMAGLLGVPLHVIHVVSTAEFETNPIPRPPDHYGADIMQAARTRLVAQLEEALGPKAAAIHVTPFGDPASEIIAYADQVDADMVVITAESRSRLGKLLFGSIAQAIILGSPRPVLSIKP